MYLPSAVYNVAYKAGLALPFDKTNLSLLHHSGLSTSNTKWSLYRVYNIGTTLKILLL